MKYQLIILFIALSSFQRISGDEGLFEKELAKLKGEAGTMLDKFIQPVLRQGQHVIEELQRMNSHIAKLNPNTTECKEFEATLKNVTDVDQNIMVTLIQSSLKIKQEILNVETECAKNGTLVQIAKCIKQNMGTVIQDIKNLKPIIIKDLELIKSLAKTVRGDFVQCLKSQVITTAKPDVTTSQAPTTTKLPTV